MKKKRHSLETIMRILRQAEAEKSIIAVCREYEITEQTLYRWRRKYDRTVFSWFWFFHQLAFLVGSQPKPTTF
jgi:transposase-like protein